VIKSKLIS